MFSKAKKKKKKKTQKDPVSDFLIIVSNKDTTRKFTRVFLVSLVLTLNRYLLP